MENITPLTIVFIALMVGLFFLVSRKKNTIFSSQMGSSKQSSARSQKRAGIGNAFGSSLASGNLGEFEGVRRLK